MNQINTFSNNLKDEEMITSHLMCVIYKCFMTKMLQLLCCKFVMIKIADKPWQIIGLGPATLLRKKTLAQVFSCEFCEIYQNTFYYRAPLVAASGVLINFAILEPFSNSCWSFLTEYLWWFLLTFRCRKYVFPAEHGIYY